MLDGVTDQWRRVVREGYQAGAFTTADPVVINALLNTVKVRTPGWRGGRTRRRGPGCIARGPFLLSWTEPRGQTGG
jgi:hypothetical protein